MEGPIKGCLDNLSHDWLLSHIPMDRLVLRKWLKSGYCENGSFYHTIAGTPQGGIISPTLMNMALDGLQSRLDKRFPSTTVEGHRAKIHLVRYADDFVITGDTQKPLCNDVMPVVCDFLAEHGLTLSPEKTRIVHIRQGFDFLGQNIQKYSGKLLIKPSKMNLKTFLHKVSAIIGKNKSAPAWLLISLLNPVIRGWVNYHGHAVAKKTFSYVDHPIWLKLWQWCVRRHPKKGKRWVQRKYFTSFGMRSCIFIGIDAEKRKYIFFKADSTPISVIQKSKPLPLHTICDGKSISSADRIICWKTQYGERSGYWPYGENKAPDVQCVNSASPMKPAGTYTIRSGKSWVEGMNCLIWSCYLRIAIDNCTVVKPALIHLQGL